MQNEYISKVIPVSLLNQQVGDLLNQTFPPLWVSGEISNLTRAASGHWYFVLKDAAAQVRCVMFRHKAQYVDWQVANGEQVELFASVGFYVPRGEFQLTIETMRRAGRGSLFEAFEQLKAKLAAEGLFASTRKRPLPTHPAAIGVISSPQAAALRDILIALRRRAPHIPVIIYPAPVQGDGAAAKLTQAVRTANARAEVDVLIVARGGGSIEDLWSFNDEALARAIAGSDIPVVSGVGHETDFTIADFAADVRAATPTAAAELVSPDGAVLRHRLLQARERLQRGQQRMMEQRMQQLDWLARRLIHPGERLARQSEQLSQLERRLQQALERRVNLASHRVQQARLRLKGTRPDLQPLQWRLAQTEARLKQGLQTRMQTRQHQLDRLANRLQGLDPTAVLARGYSLVTNLQGEIIRSPAQVAPGEALAVQLQGGKLEVNAKRAAPVQTELPL
ncbi:exodeoxyribonuclease VII large subunit [Leeia oryzae]|uniref:exodeoxyribonuclease VII large subunit n=1 Tax=Leeia oryzae TaxID=356662 RepID=UPI00036030A9|nr:exodeoxyribonuclease VII large subunit [Leeia oryzae]